MDVVLAPQSAGGAGGGGRGQGAAAGGDGGRARRSAARPRAAPGSSRRRARGHGAEETALDGFASFPSRRTAGWPAARADRARGRRRSTPETQAFLAQVANQAHIVMENSRLFERVREPGHPRQPDRPVQPPPHHGSRPARVRARGPLPGRRSACSWSTSTTSSASTTSTATPPATRVLREMAQLLRDTLRTMDSLGRYGGEEFVAVLPHTGPEEARQTAERIRYRVQQRRSTPGRAKSASPSAWAWPPVPRRRVDSPEALMREADKALYRAKEAGRNRVASDKPSVKQRRHHADGGDARGGLQGAARAAATAVIASAPP